MESLGSNQIFRVFTASSSWQQHPTAKKEENSSLRLMIVVMYYDILRTYIKAIVPWLTMCKITLD